MWCVYSPKSFEHNFEHNSSLVSAVRYPRVGKTSGYDRKENTGCFVTNCITLSTTTKRVRRSTICTNVCLRPSNTIWFSPNLQIRFWSSTILSSESRKNRCLSFRLCIWTDIGNFATCWSIATASWSKSSIIRPYVKKSFQTDRSVWFIRLRRTMSK